jgi:hypothetical protein
MVMVPICKGCGIDYIDRTDHSNCDDFVPDGSPLSWHDTAVLISNHQAWHGDGLPQVATVRTHRTFRWCWTCGLPLAHRRPRARAAAAMRLHHHRGGLIDG